MDDCDSRRGPTVTQIAIETVNRFLQQEGSIGVVDHAGITRMLHLALPQGYLDLAQTAHSLWHNGVWHSREEFAQLCVKFKIEEIETARLTEAGDALFCTADVV
jgi:hypothetical protein